MGMILTNFSLDIIMDHVKKHNGTQNKYNYNCKLCRHNLLPQQATALIDDNINGVLLCEFG